ncbi:MarR family winged helix-turn-helix transcriptional regulator [Ideonella livida]|uniref:MarR family transcriptional regulator n=1 Tax=Ideonella livida TaxID=2707176 RepID=A0A7C9PJW1_9BURK|nr:MarR family transcriptional regulator [Ideonella livida]
MPCPPSPAAGLPAEDLATDAQAHPLNVLPGHAIRRLQQQAVALFMQETEGHNLTPVQFAALRMVADRPGLDQRGLAREISFDTSTTAGVVDRLEARGLMQRNASPSDRRVRLLTLTAEGAALLAAVMPAMERAQWRILEPLAPAERQQFMALLHKLVDAGPQA